MAEAITLLGAAAAAAQFAEMGFKVVYKCSVLVKESREYPEFLQRTHGQMHHLISLATATADNTGTSEQSANNQHSIQLEDIWKTCLRQAQIIDTALQSMKLEVEGAGILGQWKKLCLHPRIQGIEKALGELERCKTTLALYLGNEALHRMGRMHHDVAATNDKFDHFEGFLSRMFEEYHKKTENTILDAIQQAQTAKSLDFKAYEKQKRNGQHKAHSMVVPYSANQEQSPRVQRSLTGKIRKEINHPDAVFRTFKKIEWSKLLTLAGNTVVLQFGSHSKNSFTSASEDDKKRFLNFYLRLRTAWLFDLVVLNFSLQQYPGASPVQASLKALTRVRQHLPLVSFFRDIYGVVLKTHGKKWNFERYKKRMSPSKEQQYRLFTIARKKLLQNFYAGHVSPSFVDEHGRTLLHLQAWLYCPRLKHLFVNMTRFLISMGFDTEVTDDDLQTAQNILGDRIFYSRKTFLNEAPLPWTGLSKLPNDMSASKILTCFQIWPEAIVDTGYDQICDIVSRKFIDDLKKLRDVESLDSMQRRQQISALTFAAAASWPEGVEALISMGYSRFGADSNRNTPLGIAIDIKCTPAVEILLRGDCLEFLASSAPSLPSEFRKAAERDDSRLHDIVIECLSRHNFLLPKLLPYHDLVGNANMIRFAQKLFISGFRDIDSYNHLGYTPLMVACVYGNTKMASFLLQHGADPYKCHENVDLRAGHFFEIFSIMNIEDGYFYEYLLKFKGVLRKLFETALDSSFFTGSHCRCSPDGFNHAITRNMENIMPDICFPKRAFEKFLKIIDPSPTDRKRYWRAFVVAATFNCLGMTHTCTELYPEPKPFPDNRRIEIESEEEDLFFEQEEMVARFDLLSERFGDDLSQCVDEFFDDLEGELIRQPQLRNNLWEERWTQPDFFGSGKMSAFRSYRGQTMKYGYKEIVEEESMLRWLFP